MRLTIALALVLSTVALPALAEEKSGDPMAGWKPPTLSDAWTMTMGKQKVVGRNATLLVRRDGRWRVKAMMEGGWGDMMIEGASAAGTGAGK